MMINKAYKFRIYPPQAQAILFNKTIDRSRFVVNHFLSLWNHTYKVLHMVHALPNFLP